MAIKIITDSSSDLSLETLRDLNVEMVPLTVNFNEKSYKDRIEITPVEFYNKLEVSDELPFTSQVNPAQFLEVFKKNLNEGHEIIGLFISSKLSGTYNSAKLAKEMIGSEKIHIFDSYSVGLGLAILVRETVQKVMQGVETVEIIKWLEKVHTNIQLAFVVDTLEYLKKGGRLSPGKAMIGNILKVKPILTIKEGQLVPLDNVRGRKKAIKWIMDWLDNNEYDLNNKIICIEHSNDIEYLNQFKENLLANYNIKEIVVVNAGAVVGTHAGPGAIGLSFLL